MDSKKPTKSQIKILFISGSNEMERISCSHKASTPPSFLWLIIQTINIKKIKKYI
jgi:hypothetical protein